MTRRSPDEARTLRSREQAVLLFLLGLGCCILFPMRAVTAPEFSTPTRVWMSLIGIGYGLFAMLRLARCGVRYGPEGIEVVNPFRTHRLGWSEIRQFTIRRWWIFPVAGSVELRSGRRVHAWGIQAPNPLTRPRNTSAQELIEELNQALGLYGEDGDPGAPAR